MEMKNKSISELMTLLKDLVRISIKKGNSVDAGVIQKAGMMNNNLAKTMG